LRDNLRRQKQEQKGEKTTSGTGGLRTHISDISGNERSPGSGFFHLPTDNGNPRDFLTWLYLNNQQNENKQTDRSSCCLYEGRSSRQEFPLLNWKGAPYNPVWNWQQQCLYTLVVHHLSWL